MQRKPIVKAPTVLNSKKTGGFRQVPVAEETSEDTPWAPSLPPSSSSSSTSSVAKHTSGLEAQPEAGSSEVPFDPALDVMTNPPRVPIRSMIPMETADASKLDVDLKPVIVASQKYITITYDKKKFPVFSAPARINWPIQVYKPKGEMRGTPEEELAEAIQKIMDTSKNGGLSVAIEMPDPEILAKFKTFNERLYTLYTKNQALWKLGPYHWQMLLKQINGDEDARESYKIAKDTNTASEVPTDENVTFTYALRTKISHTTQFYRSEADWKKKKPCKLRYLPEFSNCDLRWVFNLASIYTQDLKGRTASPRMPALAFVKMEESQGEEQPDLITPALRKRKHEQMTPAAPPNTPEIIPTVVPTATESKLNEFELPPPLIKEDSKEKKPEIKKPTDSGKEKKEETVVEDDSLEVAAAEEEEQERPKKSAKPLTAQLKGFH